MTPERQRLAEQYFAKALELPPPGRSAQAAAWCGSDAELWDEVRALLEFHEASEGPLDGPRPFRSSIVNASPRDHGDSTLAPGSKLGHYAIREVLGTGGMGVVYLADQHRPRRTVALKVIRPGYADKAMLRRFEHEAELLGRLQHPGIAQIFEAGTATTAAGEQPFLAMELVQGSTFGEYANQHRLGISERIELLVRVCEGVEHAHQRGVIHRDLKPGNIIVDSAGQPKILDFGVARATESDHRATLQTSVGQLVGTLPYMSPEQVEGDPSQIDTRCDVYAIGVIGYELLGGRLPLDVGTRSIVDAVRVIRDGEAPRLGKVRGECRGDLEVIVARAMEKDRTRRYQSAGALAAEFRRFLAGEPIEAKRDSAWYVLRKQARRHKALVISGAVVFALVAGSAILASIQARRYGLLARSERRERTRAEHALSNSNIERARLLNSAGAADEAEPILWAEHFRDPDSLIARWSLWEFYARNPRTASIVLGRELPTSIAVSPHGTMIAHESERTGVRVLSASLDRTLAEVPTGFENVRSMVFHPADPVLYTGDFGGRIGRIEVPGGLQIARPSNKAVLYLGISKNGEVLLAGDSDGIRRVLDPANLTIVQEFEPRPGLEDFTALSPDGRSFAIAGAGGGGVLVCNAATGQVERTIETGAFGIHSMAYSADGGALHVTLRGSDPVEFAAWDVAKGTLRRHAALDVRPPMQIARIEAFDDVLLFGTGMTQLDPRRPDRSNTLTRQARGFNTAAVSADGLVVASSLPPSGLGLWEGAPWKAAAQLDMPFASWALFTPDGRVMVLAGSDIRLFETGRRKRLAVIEPSGILVGLAIAPDGRTLASIEGHAVVVRDLSTGQAVNHLHRPDHAAAAICFAPDGRLISAGNGIFVWDVVTGESQPAAAPPGSVSQVLSLPDGRSLLHKTAFGDPVRCDLRAGAEVSRFDVAAHPNSMVLSQAGDRLAISTWAGTVEIWQTDPPRRLVSLRGVASATLSMAFSPDGRVLATGCDDGRTMLWESETGLLLCTLDGPPDDVRAVAFSPDGSWLLCAHRESPPVRWDLRYYDHHVRANAAFNYERLRRAGDTHPDSALWTLPDGGDAPTPRQGLPVEPMPGRPTLDPSDVERWGSGPRTSPPRGRESQGDQPQQPPPPQPPQSPQQPG